MHTVWIALLLLCCTTACQRGDELEGISYTTVRLPVQGKVRAIYAWDDHFLLAGGDRGKNGFVVRTDSAFTQFEVMTNSLAGPIYDLVWYRDRYVLATEEAQIVYSTDLRNYTNHFFRQENWVNDQYKRPLRQLTLAADSTLYLTGGGDMQFGVIFEASPTLDAWVPTEINHELRTLYAAPNGVTYVGGNGYVARNIPDDEGWQQVRTDNHFFTTLGELSCTYGGQLYYTDFPGSVYGEPVFRKASRDGRAEFLTRTGKATAPSGQLVRFALGDRGAFCYTQPGATTLQCGHAFGDRNLYDAWQINPTTVVLAAEDATVVLWKFTN